MVRCEESLFCFLAHLIDRERENDCSSGHLQKNVFSDYPVYNLCNYFFVIDQCRMVCIVYCITDMMPLFNKQKGFKIIEFLKLARIIGGELEAFFLENTNYKDSDSQPDVHASICK